MRGLETGYPKIVWISEDCDQDCDQNGDRVSKNDENSHMCII